MPTSPTATTPRLCWLTKSSRCLPNLISWRPCLSPVGLIRTTLPSINSHGPMSPIASSSSPVTSVWVCGGTACTAIADCLSAYYYSIPPAHRQRGASEDPKGFENPSGLANYPPTFGRTPTCLATLRTLFSCIIIGDARFTISGDGSLP